MHSYLKVNMITETSLQVLYYQIIFDLYYLIKSLIFKQTLAAEHLIAGMLTVIPSQRSKMFEIIDHPYV
jgi:hypothetical protein